MNLTSSGRTSTQDGRIELKMSIDYGLNWPLSDIFWEKELDWDELITPELKQRVEAWCHFFSDHADYESEEFTFGSEQNRRWFDLEAVALLNELDRQIGDRFKVVLDLWY